MREQETPASIGVLSHMYAVIFCGGKQHKVREGDRISVDLLDANVGSTIELDKVLLLSDGTEIRQDIPSTKHFATLEQIHQWLEDAGFIVEEEYGDYRRNPIRETTNRAIIWAKKM